MTKRKANSVSVADPVIWQNRITRYGEAAPDQLLANEKNWRTHPQAQQDNATYFLKVGSREWCGGHVG